MMSEIPSIEDQLPKSLDNIIRKNRDKFSLRLANDEDFATLSPMASLIDHAKPVKATIDEWRVVCFVRHNSDGNFLFLTGVHQKRGCVWSTSYVEAVDFENNLVLTKNSLYRLGSKGEGETDLYVNLHLCYCFHAWGLGQMLGAPYVFY